MSLEILWCTTFMQKSSKSLRAVSEKNCRLTNYGSDLIGPFPTKDRWSKRHLENLKYQVPFFKSIPSFQTLLGEISKSEPGLFGKSGLQTDGRTDGQVRSLLTPSSKLRVQKTISQACVKRNIMSNITNS